MSLRTALCASLILACLPACSKKTPAPVAPVAADTSAPVDRGAAVEPSADAGLNGGEKPAAADVAMAVESDVAPVPEPGGDVAPVAQVDGEAAAEAAGDVVAAPGDAGNAAAAQDNTLVKVLAGFRNKGTGDPESPEYREFVADPKALEGLVDEAMGVALVQRDAKGIKTTLVGAAELRAKELKPETTEGEVWTALAFLIAEIEAMHPSAPECDEEKHTCTYSAESRWTTLVFEPREGGRWVLLGVLRVHNESYPESLSDEASAAADAALAKAVADVKAKAVKPE